MQEPTVHDHPLVRKSHTCPLCTQHKGEGGLVCWPCFRKHDMRNGDTPEVRATLDKREATLALQETLGRDLDRFFGIRR